MLNNLLSSSIKRLRKLLEACNTSFKPETWTPNRFSTSSMLIKEVLLTPKNSIFFSKTSILVSPIMNPNISSSWLIPQRMVRSLLLSSRQSSTNGISVILTMLVLRLLLILRKLSSTTSSLSSKFSKTSIRINKVLSIYSNSKSLSVLLLLVWRTTKSNLSSRSLTSTVMGKFLSKNSIEC